VVLAVVGGVAVVEEEAAAVFFMEVDGAGGAAWGPAGLDDEALAVATLALLRAGAFDGVAGLTGLAAETFFAAGTACLATDVFLTAGFGAGLALAAGFFTVTGSFDELERTFNGLPHGIHIACRHRGAHVVRVLADGEPRGYTPEFGPETHTVLWRKSHFVLKEERDGPPQQARDCIENSGRSGNQTRH
jgi:hypothetical protein